MFSFVIRHVSWIVVLNSSVLEKLSLPEVPKTNLTVLGSSVSIYAFFVRLKVMDGQQLANTQSFMSLDLQTKGTVTQAMSFLGNKFAWILCHENIFYKFSRPFSNKKFITGVHRNSDLLDGLFRFLTHPVDFLFSHGDRLQVVTYKRMWYEKFVQWCSPVRHAVRARELHKI